jgi:hypothetical protein
MMNWWHHRCPTSHGILDAWRIWKTKWKLTR